MLLLLLLLLMLFVCFCVSNEEEYFGEFMDEH